MEILTLDYKLKKKLLSTEIGFWRRDEGATTLLRGRNEVIGERKGVMEKSWRE